ncbi:MAG: PEP-CTERM sorting domain-containing protein [bacterium]
MSAGQAAPLELENLELSSGPIALRWPPVPEPTGLWLIGVVVLGLWRKRR